MYSTVSNLDMVCDQARLLLVKRRRDGLVMDPLEATERAARVLDLRDKLTPADIADVVARLRQSFGLGVARC